MQVFNVFVCTLVAITFVKAGDEFSQEFKEKLVSEVQEIGLKCADTENANGEDLGELMARRIPTRKEGKCVIACFNQAYGIQDKDGKFTKDGIINSLQRIKKESEAVFKRIEKLLIETCFSSVKSADRCEAAAEMSACANKYSDEAGLTIDLIM